MTTTAPEDAPPTSTTTSWLPLVVGVLAVAAVIVIGAVIVAVAGSGSDDTSATRAGETVTFVVPRGTTAKMVEGETLEIMPDEVQLKVGDTLVIRNDDTETVEVGPYLVRGRETLTQTFQQPQTIVGTCGLSPSGVVKIIVA